MQTSTSADGTPIAYDRSGEGPAIVFVVGAFNDRTKCAPLAALLESRFTVVTYDRRGRGDSGDTPPYAIDREIDDLDALIAEVGGTASVFGFSSGALLAVKAVARGSAIDKLALYEPPFPAEDDDHQPPADLADRLAALVAADRPGDAVELFQREGIGLPAEMIAGARRSPYWPALEAFARSLVYDATISSEVGRPTPDEFAAVTVSTLVLNGARTWPALQVAAQAVADAMPTAEHRTLPGGENHEIDPVVVAEELTEFFAGFRVG